MCVCVCVCMCVCVLMEHENCAVASDKTWYTRAVHGRVPIMQLIRVKCNMEHT